MKMYFMGMVVALFSSTAMSGVLVSETTNLNDYIAVTFDVLEDVPTIKADGLLVSNQQVWVEKLEPVFETQFSGYDFPFTVHDLSAHVGASSGTIVTGFGDKGLREMQIFDGGWVWQPWYKASQNIGVPEPSTLGMVGIALLGLIRRKR